MKLLVATLFVCGCSAVQLESGGPADIDDGTKADGGPGIEVMARITPGTTDAVLSIAVPRLGYVFYAAEDSEVTFEVTHGGTDMGLDTKLVVYGPRLQNGQYIKTFATDEDSGYGKLSRIKNFHVPMSGFYLVELGFGENATASDGAHARLAFTCNGTCDSPDPIVPIDEGLKWYRRSAERRVLTSQVYAMATQKLNDKVAAGVPNGWAVVLDIDETTLNNSAYQQSRLDLGLGFSPGSWTAWVNQRAATAIDGVVDFTHTAKQLGGTVALVTNRKAVGECQPTEDNLHALGVEYDVILCQVDVSDKNPRFAQLQQMGYTAVEYVGDNILDFPALSQDLRDMDASSFDQFGQDFFLIPNPMYGSFDKNTTPDPM